MSETVEIAACIHACSMGCGRKYDMIVVQVIDGSTLMLCIPCFTSFAVNIMKAMLEKESPEVLEALQLTDLSNVMLVNADVPEYILPDFSDSLPEDEFEFSGEEEEESELSGT